MTLHLLDIASYQAGLNLAAAKAAGFGAVNIKTTQGVSYVNEAAKDWAKEARRLGMGICTFHWLDNSASGKEQAHRAFQWMTLLGGPQGMAHQCDNEDNATWQITRDYVTEMRALLGRHIAMYTGDWWWNIPARRWNGASLTPYLWAAPSVGYLSTYPGDQSPYWKADYGGWSERSVLQYAVGPIPGAGGGAISKSAIRDPRVWPALTGAIGAPTEPPQPSEQEPTMFIAKRKGDPTCFLIYADGAKVRALKNQDALTGYLNVGVKMTEVPSQAALDDMIGTAQWA
jgi:hypothetical protein